MIQRLRSCQEAAAEIGVSGRRLRQLLKEGRVEGARFVANRWMIPYPVRLTDGPPLGRRPTTSRVAAEIGVSIQGLYKMLKRGRIVGARKVGSRWVIPSPVKIRPVRKGRPPGTGKK